MRRKFLCRRQKTSPQLYVLHFQLYVLWNRVSVRARRGQGTTEYAILVGVLVVIAIIAIVSFRGRIQELWDAIASGIGSL